VILLGESPTETGNPRTTNNELTLTNSPVSEVLSPAALSDLLAGCARNQRRSQELLYRKFYGYAMGVCLRYTATREQAVEVLNDGFLKVFTRLEQYDPNQPFKSWLRRILINTALDQYRQEVRHYYHDDVSGAEQVPAQQPDAHSMLAHEELIRLIQRLSPAYRIVFNLYIIDGFSHDEIAAQLGISAGTSKSNLARARENLKQMLQKKSLIEYARVS
jgi:RNA polymerase sigma factor (sigma-70 family)